MSAEEEVHRNFLTNKKEDGGKLQANKKHY